MAEVLAMAVLPQATGGGSGVVATVGEAGSVCCCCWGVAVDGRLMTDSSSSFWESAADWSSIVSLKLGPSGDVFLKTEKQTVNKTHRKYSKHHTLLRPNNVSNGIPFTCCCFYNEIMRCSIALISGHTAKIQLLLLFRSLSFTFQLTCTEWRFQFCIKM